LSANEKKKKLPYNPAITFLGIYLKGCKSAYSRNTCALMFTAPLLTVAKLWTQPRYPTIDG
jgi:hypothetical protein